MFTYITVYCPVCPKTKLGDRKRNTAGTFLCSDCQFLFPVDKEGNFLTPVKYTEPKDAVRCGCPGCGR